MVGLNDSGGARIQEDGRPEWVLLSVFRTSIASGWIPQISVTGPRAGGTVYAPALTDLIIMVILLPFITGPAVISGHRWEAV